MWLKHVFYFLGLTSFPSTAGETEPSLISLLSQALIKKEFFAGVSHLDHAWCLGMFSRDEFSFHGDKYRLPGALGFKPSTGCTTFLHIGLLIGSSLQQPTLSVLFHYLAL